MKTTRYNPCLFKKSKMEKPVILLLSVFLAISCSKDKIDSNTILVDHDKRKILFASQLFSEIKYVPLETNKNCLIDNWWSVYVTDDFIISIGDEIYVFNRETGSFLKKLGNKGNGPNEYQKTITKNSFNGLNNSVFVKKEKYWLELFIDDSVPVKINMPELGIVDFEGVFSISAIDNFIQTGTNKYFAFLNNHNGSSKLKALLFDKNGSVLNTYPNYLKYKNDPKMMMKAPGIYYRYQDDYFFKELFNDTIFKIKDIRLEAAYWFNLGKYKQDYEDQEVKYRNTYINIEKVFESDNYIFFDYWINHKYYCGYYDKRKRNSIILDNKDNETGFVNDFDFIGSFHPISITNRQELIGILPSSVVCSSNSNMAIKKNKHLQKLTNITLESNPIVMIAKLK